MAATRVRPLATTDKPDWHRLWSKYLEFYETSVPEAVYYKTFERLLSNRQGEYSCLVAMRGKVTVGFVHFLFHRHCWKIEDVCYLQDLYVEESERGKGVGRTLIEAVYAEADAAACPTVYWTTQHFNTVARRLYDRIVELTPFIRYNRRLSLS